MTRKEIVSEALKQASPVMISYLFIGMAYGIMMKEAGYGPWWALGISLFVYTGAFQFVLITFLQCSTPMITIVLTALFMNSRQAFYGLTFLDDFNAMKKKKWYMVASLTDETYAVDCTMLKDGALAEADRHEIMFYVALFSHLTWAAASVIGNIGADFLPINTNGIDFCMTALFTTIFIDQWRAGKDHFPALCGLGVSIVFCILFGADHFILPSLLVVCALLLLRRTMEKEAVS